jgi:thymidylate synthase
LDIEDGEIVASSKGLHIYDHCFDMAKVLRMKEDIILKGEK